MGRGAKGVDAIGILFVWDIGDWDSISLRIGSVSIVIAGSIESLLGRPFDAVL